MLHWFGHRARCATYVIPSYRGEDALVCVHCMPDLVPHCAICGCPAGALGVLDGFAHYTFWYLCPACVTRVRGAGHWKLRRARANQARVDALTAGFPDLLVTEVAPRRITLGGEIHARAVSITLKLAARQGEGERYVLRVALRAPLETVDCADLAIDEDLVAHLTRGSPSITVDHCRWLRLGIRHLGKLDALRVLQGMLDAADRLDHLCPLDIGHGSANQRTVVAPPKR